MPEKREDAFEEFLGNLDTEQLDKLYVRWLKSLTAEELSVEAKKYTYDLASDVDKGALASIKGIVGKVVIQSHSKGEEGFDDEMSVLDALTSIALTHVKDSLFEKLKENIEDEAALRRILAEGGAKIASLFLEDSAAGTILSLLARSLIRLGQLMPPDHYRKFTDTVTEADIKESANRELISQEMTRRIQEPRTPFTGSSLFTVITSEDEMPDECAICGEEIGKNVHAAFLCGGVESHTHMGGIVNHIELDAPHVAHQDCFKGLTPDTLSDLETKIGKLTVYLVIDQLYKGGGIAFLVVTDSGQECEVCEEVIEPGLVTIKSEIADEVFYVHVECGRQGD